MDSTTRHEETEPLITNRTQSRIRKLSETYVLDVEAVGKTREGVSPETEQRKRAQRQLIIASIVCVLFMIAEVIGGYISGSLAIMTDAAHMLSDFASFLISLFALWIAGRPASKTMSFGYSRAEILGAIMSVFMIWVLTGVLIYEAVQRTIHPEPVDGKIMFITACLGLGANIIMALTLGHNHGHGGVGHGHSHGGEVAPRKVEYLDDEEDDKKDNHSHSHGGGEHHDHAHKESEHHDHAHEESGHHDHAHEGYDAVQVTHDNGHSKPRKGRKSKKGSEGHGHAHGGNVNVRAAFIHVIGDMVQSVGVIIAAIIIWIRPDLTIVDPICTFLFSVLVLFTTFTLLKDTLNVLMEGTPEGVDPVALTKDLEAIPGVTKAHDLHIWSITVGKPASSIHLTISSEHADKA
eukprot:Ihof_evm3s58 gene=Ihof_evmTU3s58